MIQTRLLVPALVAAGILFTSSPAPAAWDNVFQVTCWGCRKQTTYYYSEPAPAPVVRESHYEQRCYYEPITVLKPQIERIEVPVQVRSYYWDPVTTYSYSSYYDSCSGACQQIAVPRTSYVRKEQCNTVMKYVERTRMVPVEVQRKVCEKRPVYTYYGPVIKTYDNTCSSCELPSTSSAPPHVDVIRPAPTVTPETSDRIPPQNIPTIPQSNQRPSTSRYNGPINARTTARETSAGVHGEVVVDDLTTPRPGAKLVFINASDLDNRKYASADQFGSFDIRLPAGEWYVYIGKGDGKAQYFKKITLDEYDSREFKLVSR